MQQQVHEFEILHPTTDAGIQIFQSKSCGFFVVWGIRGTPKEMVSNFCRVDPLRATPSVEDKIAAPPPLSHREKYEQILFRTLPLYQNAFFSKTFQFTPY